ncbi:MAG: hypothetical protein Kow00105_15210 [Phycisphaeraceae bacterium]
MMVEVARRSPVPIACGEDYHRPEQFAELLKHEAVQILQPEPLYLGGIGITKKITGMIDAHGGLVCPHSAQGPVGTAACAHLNASTPNFFIHEFFDNFNNEQNPWLNDVLDHYFEVRDGHIEVSDRPGLGIDLNPDVIAEHPYRRGNIIRLFETGWERREHYED